MGAAGLADQIRAPSDQGGVAAGGADIGVTPHAAPSAAALGRGQEDQVVRRGAS